GTSHSESQTQGASEVLHKRMLITPDEVGRLFGNRQNPAMVALISGMQPLALKRTVYFGDAMFEGAYDVHPDHPAPLTLEDRAQQRRAQAQIDRMRCLLAEREKDNDQPPETKPARSVFGTIFWLLVWCIIGGSVAWQVMQM